MFQRILLFPLVCLAFVATAHAQSDNDAFVVGNDTYLSGGTLTFDRSGTDDLYAAGSVVTADTELNGSAYLAGRKVTLKGRVGGNAHIAAMDIDLSADVFGDASLAGNTIEVGDVGGDLRASGGTITLNGTVGSYALLAADEVFLNGTITGDTYLAGRSVSFGKAARIEGKLIVYEEETGSLAIPTHVAPDTRIERRSIDDWEGGISSVVPRSWTSVVGSFLTWVVIIAVLASLIAAFMPDTLAKLRVSLLERPHYNLWVGFLAQSIALGSAVIFGITLLGIFLIPACLIIAGLLGFAGYVVGAYSLGVGVLSTIGRSVPDDLQARALAAAAGALMAGLIAVIPFIGWLFVLALILAGSGAITAMVFQPAFFAAPAPTGEA